MTEKHLYRSCNNRILGGVCGGLGQYFDIDPVLIRLIVVLLVFTGISILFYIVAWIIVPEDPTCASGKTGADEIKEKAEKFASDIKEESKKNKIKVTKDDGKIIIGFIIIAIGILFLLQNVLGFHIWQISWPLLLIVVGIAVVLNNKR